ncbi:hypothetical protein TrCOL_g4761 [Triparma columacea]|uniref:Protein kinase domain-containing protein n=1 Tax=Triparma columacea TaxID=722753 RepID=A0A9W7G785_9STRA|nr:hypothetical protein TrCOL_g4761 [Triparma columacea]
MLKSSSSSSYSAPSTRASSSSFGPPDSKEWGESFLYTDSEGFKEKVKGKTGTKKYGGWEDIKGCKEGEVRERVWNNSLYLLRIYPSHGWDALISFSPPSSPLASTVIRSPYSSPSLAFSPPLSLQTIIHGFPSPLRTHPLTKHPGPGNLHELNMPSWIFVAGGSRVGGGGLIVAVVKAIMKQLLRKVKEIHQSAYVHRNINSLTVECRFAYDGGVEGRRGEVDEYVMVEVLGEEIAVDVWTKEYDNKGQPTNTVFRSNSIDACRHPPPTSSPEMTSPPLLFQGPRWLRCLSDEIEIYNTAVLRSSDEDQHPPSLQASTLTSSSSTISSDTLARRINANSSTTTRGFIPPETIKKISESTCLSPSEEDAGNWVVEVTKREEHDKVLLRAEDVYGCGAILRHMVTGVPPHLTIASYVAKLEKRLSLQPECPTTLRAIEGVTHLARVGYGCLKLMRDMLNSDVEKRITIATALSSPWLKPSGPQTPGTLKKERGKSILDRGNGSPVIITKPETTAEGWGVPSYIKDEFNRLMEWSSAHPADDEGSDLTASSGNLQIVVEAGSKEGEELQSVPQSSPDDTFTSFATAGDEEEDEEEEEEEAEEDELPKIVVVDRKEALFESSPGGTLINNVTF